MKKLQRAIELLPLVEKAQRKGISVELDYARHSLDFWHYQERKNAIKIEVNSKYTLTKVINYINSLL